MKYRIWVNVRGSARFFNSGYYTGRDDLSVIRNPGGAMEYGSLEAANKAIAAIGWENSTECRNDKDTAYAVEVLK